MNAIDFLSNPDGGTLRKYGIKKRARIKIQPRFKIQYPMKNRGKCKRLKVITIYPKAGIF
jgi:hypothetical protein